MRHNNIKHEYHIGMNMLQAVGDLAKVCVEEKVAAGWGVMEGQVVGRHPEGSGGSPAPQPCSRNPLCSHASQVA